jgi:hypothetical protein
MVVTVLKFEFPIIKKRQDLRNLYIHLFFKISHSLACGKWLSKDQSFPNDADKTIHSLS